MVRAQDPLQVGQQRPADLNGLRGAIAEVVQEPDRPPAQPQEGQCQLAAILTGERSRVLVHGQDLLDQVPVGRAVLPRLLQRLRLWGPIIGLGLVSLPGWDYR